MCRYEYLDIETKGQVPSIGLRILKILEPFRVVEPYFAGKEVPPPPVEGQLVMKPFSHDRIWGASVRTPGVFKTWLEQQRALLSRS